MNRQMIIMQIRECLLSSKMKNLFVYYLLNFGIVLQIFASATVPVEICCDQTIQDPVESEVVVWINVEGVEDLDTGQFVLYFDHNIFEFQRISVTNTLMSGAYSITNETTPGKIKSIINMPGLTGISGTGKIAKLYFLKSIRVPDATTTIRLADVLLGATSGHKIPIQITKSSVLIRNENPLAVSLSYFSGHRVEAGVYLEWTTESEIENLGFNVYRSTAKDRENRRVNSALIEGHGTDGMSHSYSFLDSKAKNDQIYFYYIESVDFAGQKNRSRIIKVTKKQSKCRLITWGSLKSL